MQIWDYWAAGPKICFEPASPMIRARQIVLAEKRRIWDRKQNLPGQANRILGRTLPCALPPGIKEYTEVKILCYSDPSTSAVSHTLDSSLYHSENTNTIQP